MTEGGIGSGVGPARSTPRGRHLRRALFALVAGGTLAASCASSPWRVRPGDPVRVTTVEGDTLVGEMVVQRADTLVFAREGVGAESVPRVAVRSVEVDRSRVRPWSRPVACLLAGTGVGVTVREVSRRGWEPDIGVGLVVIGMNGWTCLDPRPDWKPATIGVRDSSPRGRATERSADDRRECDPPADGLLAGILPGIGLGMYYAAGAEARNASPVVVGGIAW